MKNEHNTTASKCLIATMRVEHSIAASIRLSASLSETQEQCAIACTWDATSHLLIDCKLLLQPQNLGLQVLHVTVGHLVDNCLL